MEETAVKLGFRRHSDTVPLRRTFQVTGTPRPSLEMLSCPMSQESEITTCLPPLILQVLGTEMTLKSIQQSWAEQ